jgi:hypothetical protein
MSRDWGRVLGYADDCMFVSDEHAQIIEMAALFDAFLKTYNMSVNCTKTYQICKVPGSPDFVPPAVWMTRIDGTLKQAKTLKSDDPFTYLGIECSLTLNDWSKQRQTIEFKFLDKANRVRYSKASAQGAVKLFNQDCFPTVTYSMAPVSYPRPFRKTLQGIVCKALKQKGHF